jgi:NAD(P)-dependent dehydrogenase (short-subunit alcohol dehydrogenase family)
MKPVCLLTGAGGLLGTVLCELLSNDYNVIASYRRKIPRISSQLIKEISKSKVDQIQNVYCVQADLTNRDDIKRLVEVSIAKFGQIDCLVNNAVNNFSQGKLIELYQAENYPIDKLFINSVSPILLASYVFDNCWKDSRTENLQWNRNIVNVSSIAGIKLFTSSEAYYSASKSALNMLTLHLASELKAYTVRVNAICPYGFSSNPSYKNEVAKAILRLLQGTATGMIVSSVKEAT